MREVFLSSYRMLGRRAARLFRLLALHPSPRIGVCAAASLAGVSTVEAVRLLEELTRAHLVAESGSGQFTMHDLLRVYATELLSTVEPEADRKATTCRLLEHYLRTAATAAVLINPHQEVLTWRALSPDVTPVPLAGGGAAFAWFVAERATLNAAVRRAAAELHDYAWQRASTLEDFLNRRGHWQDRAEAQRIALAAGQRMAKVRVQAQASRGLGRAYARIGRHVDAYACFSRGGRAVRRAGVTTCGWRTPTLVSALLR